MRKKNRKSFRNGAKRLSVKRERNAFQNVGICGILAGAAAVSSAVWIAGGAESALALDISAGVTISDEETNAPYLNQDLTILEGGSLTYSNYTARQTQDIAITNHGELIFDVSGTNTQTLVTNSAVLTLNGSKGFTKTGTGTLQFFNGDYRVKVAYDSGAEIQILDGTFRNGEWLSQDWSENKADMRLDGTLNLWDGGRTQTAGVMIDALTGTGTITATAGSNPGLLVLGVDNGTGTFSGSILGPSADASVKAISIEKRGTGTQVFAGANSYSGTTKIKAGTLQIGSGSNSGSLGVGTVTVDAGTVLAFNFVDNYGYVTDTAIQNSGSIEIQKGLTILNALENTDSGTITVKSGASFGVKSQTFLDKTTVEDGAFLILRTDSADSTAWTPAQIAEKRTAADSPIKYGAYTEAGVTETADLLLTGTAPLMLAGNGRFNFTAPNSDFTNGIFVFSGTTALTESAALSTACPITVNQGGTFMYDLGAGTSTDIVNVVSGDGTLRIQSGTVRYTSSSPKGTSGAFTTTALTQVADGAVLVFQDAVTPRPAGTSAIEAEAGGKVRFESSSYSSIGHDTNHSLANTAGGNLILQGAGTFEFGGTGTMAILPGSDYSRAQIALSEGGWMDVSEGGNLVFGGYSYHIDWKKNKGSLNIENAASRVSLWDGNEITIDSLTGSGFLESGTIKLGISNNANSEKYGVTNNTAIFEGVIRNETVNSNLRVTSVTKVGTGTQILAGTNTYTGATTVSAGTLQIGNGGETGTLGTGTVTVKPGAALVFNTTAESAIPASSVLQGKVRNMTSTLNIGSESERFTLDQRGQFRADAGAQINFWLADGEQTAPESFSGAGTITFKSENLNLNAQKTVFAMEESGTVAVEGGGSITAPAYSQMGTLKVSEDTTWNVSQQGAYWEKTQYTNSNGLIRPETDFTSMQDMGQGKDVSDFINNSSNTSVRENGMKNNSIVSHRAYVYVPEQISLDLTGSYDDYAGFFVKQILDADGNQLSDAEWLAPLDFGGKCARVTTAGYVLEPGFYLFDARVGDVGGDAYANNGSIKDPNGTRLGLGIRLNGGALTGDTYYSFAIDENGFIGDSSLNLYAGSNPNPVLKTESFDIAAGKTLTLDFADPAETVTINADVKNTGTLALENSSGQDSVYLLSGSSQGDLYVGDGITLKLSKDIRFDLTGSYAQGEADFLVDLTGITEDTGWFTSVETAEGLTSETRFSLTTSDTQMSVTELTFFAGTGLTDEDWFEMLDLSGINGVLNVSNVFVDGQGTLHLTVGDLSALPEPSAWILLLCGLTLVGLGRHSLQRRSAVRH